MGRDVGVRVRVLVTSLAVRLPPADDPRMDRRPCDILGAGHWVKMVGVHATPHATEVVEMHLFGNVALRQLVRESMG
jgi:hypothetical protein